MDKNQQEGEALEDGEPNANKKSLEDNFTLSLPNQPLNILICNVRGISDSKSQKHLNRLRRKKMIKMLVILEPMI